MHFKKLIIPAIIFSLIIPTALAATAPKASYTDKIIEDFSEYTNPFSDTHLLMLEGKAAAELYRRGISNGYPDGEFKGHREINRAETVKFLLSARHETILEVEGDSAFTDVKPNHWFAPFVMMAQQDDITNGYPDNTFRAGNTINTVEFLKMFSRTFEIPENLPHNYVDISADAWYAPLAGIASTYELFPERDRNLDPNRKLTRTEVAIAIYNYFSLREDVMATPVQSKSSEKVEATPYSHHKLGEIDAEISIDLFGNLGGEHTLKLYKTLKEIQAAYPDKTKLVWNYFPKSSYNTTEYKTGNALECAADQDKFWEYLDIILEQSPSAFGQPLYLNAANNLGLKMNEFEICIAAEPYLGRVQRDKDQATSDELTVIPTFYINGKPHTGAKSYEYVDGIIKELLGE